jgi:hypothetical protein
VLDSAPTEEGFFLSGQIEAALASLHSQDEAGAASMRRSSRSFSEPNLTLKVLQARSPCARARPPRPDATRACSTISLPYPTSQPGWHAPKTRQPCWPSLQCAGLRAHAQPRRAQESMAAREDARRAAAQQAAEEEAAAAAEAEAAAEAARAAAEAEAAAGGPDSDAGAPSGFDLSRSNEARPSTSHRRADTRALRAAGRSRASAQRGPARLGKPGGS